MNSQQMRGTSYRIGQFARGRNLMDGTSYASSGQGLSVHGRNLGQLNLNSQEAIVISHATSQENLAMQALGGRGSMNGINTQSTLQHLSNG